MLLILSSNILLLSYKCLTISYNYPYVINYELVSVILVSPPNPKVTTAVNSVVVGTFSSILFNFFYYNYSSNYIIEPYRKYYRGFY